MYDVLKKRNERNFCIISLVIQFLYGAMVFFCYKLFNGENTGALLCVGVAGLLLTK